MLILTLNLIQGIQDDSASVHTQTLNQVQGDVCGGITL